MSTGDTGRRLKRGREMTHDERINELEDMRIERGLPTRPNWNAFEIAMRDVFTCYKRQEFPAETALEYIKEYLSAVTGR